MRLRFAHLPGALLRRTSFLLSAVMVGTILQSAAAPALAQEYKPPAPVQPDKPVAGTYGGKTVPRTRSADPSGPVRPPRAAWPAAVTRSVTVPSGVGAGTKRFAKAKDTPIGIAAPRTKRDGITPSSVETRVLDRKQAQRAGVSGLLFTLEAKKSVVKAGSKATAAADEGSVAVTVDYADFADAFGGSYASRIGLVELPACALTTPGKANCRTATPVSAVNDVEAQSLTVESVAVQAGAATVLAVTAAAESDKGDYKATSLSPSATWSTSLNTGDFGWSYDMPVPSVPGSLTPNVGISYSSGTIDGRTGGTNNQASWVGDGFDMWPGSIERRYKPCADDGEKNADGSKPGDLCWAYDNAFLSFNGKGGELVPVSTNEFKLKQDDGTRITRLKSTDRGNGDNDGEYWRLITPDSVEYYFGYNKLPGWASGNDTTDSTWTVPVFGNNTGEPCHADAFKDSWCQQAWRWNLDYVVDPRGNAIAYHYTKEANSYGRNLKADDNTTYTRGGYLKRIDYGLNKSRMFTDKPLAQVVFSSAERCLPVTGVTCAESTIDDKAFYWYDTPWDLNCKSGAKCDKGRLSPSFWTRKRLTDVTTQTLKTDGTYAKVDSWKLAHHWGMADVDYQLLLDSVQHTGESASPAVTLPKTTFAYTQLENRLDKTGDGFAPFVKDRLHIVDDEAGGKISVNYSAATCDWNALPTRQTNTTRCFPQYIGGDSSSDPELHWFNKYVVTSVTTTDRTGGAPDGVTRYQYLGGAAWHFDDDDGFAKEKSRTWSQWRGYGQVRVQSGGQGGAEAMKSQQDSYFLRGMDGDRKDTSGGTKSVSVSLDTGEGDPIVDHASAAGFGYKTVTFDKPGGKVLSKSVSLPWHHETAKKVRDWGTVTANFTGSSSSKSWTSLDDGAGAKWRTTSSATKQDTVAGRVVQVDDFGDDSTAADNQCTRTTYASDSVFLNAAARVETVTKSCTATVDRSKDVISDIRTAYDGGAYGAAPTKGDVTAIATLKEHTGTKATYLETGATYDGYGRALTSTDLTANVTVDGDKAPVRTARSDGRTSTTVYTPATGLLTQLKTTSPPATAGVASSAQTTTQTFGMRGQLLKETDTNAGVTESAYDALGRVAKIWLADRRNTQVPNYQFAYLVDDSKPTAVSTKVLNNNGGQITSYALYDGFLRERQSQSPGPDGGSILTDVFYDEQGQATKTFDPYFTHNKPSAALFEPEDAESIEVHTDTTFDGLGRPTQVRQITGNGDGGKVLNTTKTIYGGDRTTVIPPVGGTATTTVTDARGQTTALLQHHERNATAAYDTTSYEYTPRGELHKVTAPSGSSWNYIYDQLGRQTEAVDPDTGSTLSHYDDRGQLTDTEDDRGVKLFNVYDNLGRKTALREGSETGTLRAKWQYDTVSGAKGQLASSTRVVDGKEYTSSVTNYDRLYRPIKTALAIPDSEGALQGTYQDGTAYLPSGLIATRSFSAAGSQPGGSFDYSFEDETLRPIRVFGEGVNSVATYSYVGRPLTYTMTPSGGGNRLIVTNEYEPGTRRLATTRVDRYDQPGVDRHVTYGYDEAGNVLSMADVSRTGTDNQCFTYDYLGRLTEAWTQSTTTCATTPATDKIAGPAPYWHSYVYDKASNRTAETQHATSGVAGQDIKRTYAYPGAGKPQSHSLSSITTTGPTGTSTDSYGYDEVGNTTTRPGQKLEWDAEGHLAKVTEGDKTTEYLYDAEGNRLIGRTATETTLYLGHTEVTLAKGATKAKATRYVDLGGGQGAVVNDDRTVSFTIADHHGTGQLAVNAADLTLTQRRTLPFGGIRGEAPQNWPGTKGFVGGTDDTKATGLTHLGAREYDPTTGRFLSVDPLFQGNIPQTFNGYSYGAQNPLTSSDPSGLGLACGGAGGAMEGCPTTAEGKKGNGRPNEAVSGPPVKQHQCTGPDCGSATQTGQKASSKRPKLGNVDIPTRDELIAMNYGGGYPDPSYNQMLSKWGMSFCSDPGSEVCVAAHDLGWASPAVDLFGIQDAQDCTHGVSNAACIWTAVGLFPIGKIPKLAKIAKIAKKTHCKCFLAGTEVLMADGDTKKIEDVELGDVVLATDPETGESGPRLVTRLIVTDDDKRFNTLSIATEDGVEQLTATHEHPFWVPSEDRWLEAGDLKAGMSLLTDDGTTVIVTANRAFAKHAKTYNLTIDDLHTYYVLAGQTPVLVHNSGGCNVADGPRLQARLAAEELAGADGHAFQKHVVEQGEFPGIRTRAQFSDMIEGVILNGERRVRSDGASAYWRNGVIVIRNPGSRDGGTVFAPQEGYRYFTRNFKAE